MNETILVPLDGSSLAERALPYARLLAEASGARIRLLRAVHVSSDNVGDSEADQAEATREAEAYLEDVSTILRNVSSRMRLGPRAGTSLSGVATRVGKPLIVEIATSVGDATASILEEICQRHVGLVVMSTHGRSGLGRWVHGSVGDQIMRLTPTPVLLIPVAAPGTWCTDRSLRVLVPLDGSELAREALAPAMNLAKTLHAEIQILRVLVPLPYANTLVAAYRVDDSQSNAEKSDRYLESVGNELRMHGLTVSRLDAVGPAAPMIAATAREQGSDLIAMSTHGRGGVTRLLMGSVATGVVQRANVPVLIVRPEAVRTLAIRPASRIGAPANAQGCL